ncbi:unnamed protein product, partial [Rotaria sordida]
MFDSESTKESARPVTIDEESLIEITESNTIFDNIVVDRKRRQSIIPLSHQPKQVDATKDEDKFDSFILNNFNPFSGSENVIDLLDNTDKKFNLYKISRNLRYMAIPLLVESDAKRKYFRNRNNIKSFDDFYELLVINHDVIEHNTRRFQPNPSSYSLNQNNFTHNSLTHKNISFDDQQKSTTNNFDLTDNLPPCPILRSTAMVDIGATRLSESEELLQSSNIDTEVDTHDRNNSNSTNQITSTVTLIRT